MMMMMMYERSPGHIPASFDPGSRSAIDILGHPGATWPIAQLGKRITGMY